MNQTFDYLKNQIETLDIFTVLNEDLSHIKDISSKFADCHDILVFGTGGSSLGAKCLVNFQALFDGVDARVSFVENVDSQSFLNVLEKCDPKFTGVIVVSKSGRTTETLVLFSSFCEMWKNFDYQNRAIAITEFSEDNDLRMLAESKQMTVYEHNKNIGGRFSVFSIVGLLPALLSGVDIDAFVRGAKIVMHEIQNTKQAQDCPLFQDIVMMNQFFSNGKIDQHVVMSYSDFLGDYGKWFAQILAESLGKTADFGITPINATGSVDQHSLLQLFLGGPRNKLFTIITQKENAETPKIYSTMQKLNSKTIHDVMLAHQSATIEALREVAPVRVLEFERFNIENLGFLMMLSFVEILTIAHLQKINPFDQPAVEMSKKFVNKYLSSEK